MPVLEMPSQWQAQRQTQTQTQTQVPAQGRPAVRWTEVCAAEHRSPLATRTRPVNRSGGGLATRSLGPGRSGPARPATTGQPTACRVATISASPVVDDVPTWVLVACGIVFGVVMLLALALLGGPAYT